MGRIIRILFRRVLGRIIWLLIGVLWTWRVCFLLCLWLDYTTNTLHCTAKKKSLCCNWDPSKYQKVESSYLGTDYKHNLSVLN